MGLPLFRAAFTALLIVWSAPLDHVGAQSAPDIVLPKRSAPAAPSAIEPPSLPSGADAVQPLTIEVVTVRRAGTKAQTIRQTLLRTKDRILLTNEDAGSEWLFERNPIDRRRVSGYFVSHKTRRILVHHESDLRNEQRIGGWRDVLTLHFDPSALHPLRATGLRKTVGGATFERYVPHDNAGHGIAEVWWSADALFPLRTVVHQGSVVITSEVTSVEAGTAPDLLIHPGAPFPGYEMMDLADAGDKGRH